MYNSCHRLGGMNKNIVTVFQGPGFFSDSGGSERPHWAQIKSGAGVVMLAAVLRPWRQGSVPTIGKRSAGVRINARTFVLNKKIYLCKCTNFDNYHQLTSYNLPTNHSPPCRWLGPGSAKQAKGPPSMGAKFRQTAEEGGQRLGEGPTTGRGGGAGTTYSIHRSRYRFRADYCATFNRDFRGQNGRTPKNQFGKIRAKSIFIHIF